MSVHYIIKASFHSIWTYFRLLSLYWSVKGRLPQGESVLIGKSVKLSRCVSMSFCTEVRVQVSAYNLIKYDVTTQRRTWWSAEGSKGGYDYPGEHYRTQNSAWAHPCYYRAYHVSCYPFMSSQEFLVKSHGQRSLEGYSPKGPKESDTTEWLNIQASRASLPRWHSGKESPCQCRRHRRPRFNPWVGKIPYSS